MGFESLSFEQAKERNERKTRSSTCPSGTLIPHRSRGSSEGVSYPSLEASLLTHKEVGNAEGLPGAILAM
jgi:hypothetical protein